MLKSVWVHGSFTCKGTSVPEETQNRKEKRLSAFTCMLNLNVKETYTYVVNTSMPPAIHCLISSINLRYEIEYNSQSGTSATNHISEENQSYRVFWAGLSISSLLPWYAGVFDSEGILRCNRSCGTPVASSAVIGDYVTFVRVALVRRIAKLHADFTKCEDLER